MSGYAWYFGVIHSVFGCFQCSRHILSENRCFPFQRSSSKTSDRVRHQLPNEPKRHMLWHYISYFQIDGMFIPYFTEYPSGSMSGNSWSFYVGKAPLMHKHRPQGLLVWVENVKSFGSGTHANLSLVFWILLSGIDQVHIQWAVARFQWFFFTFHLPQLICRITFVFRLVKQTCIIQGSDILSTLRVSTS